MKTTYHYAAAAVGTLTSGRTPIAGADGPDYSTVADAYRHRIEDRSRRDLSWDLMANDPVEGERPLNDEERAELERAEIAQDEIRAERALAYVEDDECSGATKPIPPCISSHSSRPGRGGAHVEPCAGASPAAPRPKPGGDKHMTRAEAWDCVMGPDRSPVTLAREFGLTDSSSRGVDEWVGEATEAAIREAPKKTDGILLSREDLRAAPEPHAEWLRTEAAAGIEASSASISEDE